MGKQVVNDWDISQKRITKTWLWVCDKCGQKVISDKAPQEWGETKVIIICEDCK